MRPRGMKLSFRHRSWLYSVFSILYMSGIFWIFCHYFVHSKGDIGGSVHSLEPWFLKIHGAAALAALILLGTLIPIHMKRGWAAQMNRANGIFLIVTNLMLIVSGYALYYAGGEMLRSLSQGIHIVLGLLLPAFIFFHVVEGKKSRLKVLKRLHKKTHL